MENRELCTPESPSQASNRRACIESLAVRGGIARILIAVVLTAVLALGVTACGGGDEATTTASSNGDGTVATGDGQGSAQKNGSGRSDEVEKEQADNGREAAGADVEPAPLEVSGGGSGQFRVKGGDNSIQSWGEESDESQLEAAAEAVHDFYAARANEEWAKACTYLASSMVEQLEQFASQSGQQGSPDCARLLKALTRHPLPASVRRESTVVDAGSLRIGEDNSFLIYRGAGRTVFAMTVVEEDGAWKLTLISPTTLG